ncbi:MAG: hypothetical protein JXR60_12350 [Bacteroidales bacterium]|nr:hypothetical protein [Bacteroidales bacterium]
MEEQATTKQRPGLLTVLLILTFIGSGLGTLMMLLLAVAFTAFYGMLESIPGMAELASAGTGYFIIALLLSATSLFGAIKNVGIKKNGFLLVRNRSSIDDYFTSNFRYAI